MKKDKINDRILYEFKCNGWIVNVELVDKVGLLLLVCFCRV